MHLYEWYWLIGVVVSILYLALIVWFIKGWHSIAWYNPENKFLHAKVSVVVPFCDEEEHLKLCIDGLLKQSIKTDFLEIILVNDHSSDASPLIAQSYANQRQDVRYLDNDNPGKKNALLKAIENAEGELIVTTDADCSHGIDWLSTMVSFYQKSKAKLLIGPVVFEPVKGIFQHFQYLEFVSLVGTGAATAGIKHPTMCNGANLAFDKNAFETLQDPFNMEYVSGDDVFLLHAMKKEHSDDIHFIKANEAIVYTKPKESLSAFLNQRQRWASKAKGYKDADTLFTAFVVFLNAVLIVLGIFMLLFRVDFWKPWLFIFLTKTFADYLFFSSVDAFFSVKKYFKYLFVFEFIYAFYISFSALMGMFERKWK